MSLFKQFKKYFLTAMLFPIIPIFRTEGEEDNPAAKDEDNSSEETKEKTFTQDQLDKIVKDRLKREQKAWETKIEDEKKKAAMTETEKLKTEKEEAEKKATALSEKATQRLIKSEVIARAATLGIVDAAAAFILMSKENISVDDDDTITGVEESLKALIETKPYLVNAEKKPPTKTGDDQNEDKGSKGGFSMNDLIRKAVGR